MQCSEIPRSCNNNYIACQSFSSSLLLPISSYTLKGFLSSLYVLTERHLFANFENWFLITDGSKVLTFVIFLFAWNSTRSDINTAIMLCLSGLSQSSWSIPLQSGATQSWRSCRREEAKYSGSRLILVFPGTLHIDHLTCLSTSLQKRPPIRSDSEAALTYTF